MKKKMIQSLLVASLAFGMAVSPVTPIAFAAETGTITVQDTQKGATYKAYKVFDATVADTSATNESKDGVSYTIPDSLVEVYKSDQTFNDLFTTSSTGGKTYVIRKDTASDTAIAAWAKKVTANVQEVASVTENDSDGTASLTLSDYGYYYVSSDVNNGSVIMVTSVSPNAVIHEKNSIADWGTNGGKTVDSNSYSVGDTIKYTITYNNAVNYDNTEKVYQYTLHDDMPDSNVVALNKDSIKVTVTDSLGKETVLTQSTDKLKGSYSFTESNNDFDVLIPWAATEKQTTDSNSGGKDDFYYSGINRITVTYTGVLKNGAKPGSGEISENLNKATINPNTQKDDVGKIAIVHDGQIIIKKVDANNVDQLLNGAEFVLKNDKGQFLNFKNPEDIEWVSNQSEASIYTTNQGGTVTIKGLAEGTYSLLEIKAPAGYNLMTDETPVELKLGAEGNQDTLLVTSTVKNNKGTELPSTGGIGTTIFYIIGAILVIGAGIVLVARRRLRS